MELAWRSRQRFLTVARCEKYVCSSCHRSYKRKSALTSHLNHECGKQPQFLCPFCDYRFKTKSNFNRHLRTQHLVTACDRPTQE
ncbi:hypothetical protein PR048_000176 [Dryococelus australis]|uniref:C2H2-type domain-containing protein n=1 Tax=Dryococelus australis TaxID=614101 RepID=A0ABQ9IDY5_9NEOP|nr:hypothetical protein PR048_000176 [Dryococelus australis]